MNSRMQFARCHCQRLVGSWCRLVLVCWIAIVGTATAAQPSSGVQVQDLTAQVRTVKFIEITESAIRLKGQSPGDLKRSDVVRIDWLPEPESLLDTTSQLLLANGDRLGIIPLTITEEALRGQWVQFPAWPEVDVPLETVRGVLLNPPLNSLERSQTIVRLRQQRETQDCFYLANGDRLLGQLEGFEEGSFQLTAATGKLTLPIATVRGFGMNPELTSFPPVKEPTAVLTLTDGSMLTVSQVRLDEQKKLRCRAAFGPELTFPVEHLVSLQFLGDRVVYLNELEPDQFTSTPYLARSWPLQRNQNAVGGPLRLGTREYARGIGMHSQSLATYGLNGKYLSFQASIGIDGVTEGRGSAIFRVLADGKPVFTSDIVRGKTSPLKIGPLPMKGVKKLTLAVDFADQGDVLDHADWCDAVLIKAP